MNILIIFTWFVAILVVILFFLWYTQQIQKHFSVFVLFTSLLIFFGIIEFQLNSLETYVSANDVVKIEEEHCNLTAVSSDCIKSITTSFENTTQAQEYLALKDVEKSVNNIIIPAVGLVLIGSFIFIFIDYLKLLGLIR